VTEESELDLAPDLPAEDRAWVDSDMLFHGELGDERLTVALLRIPTVVGWDGAVHLNPALSLAGASRAGLAGRPPRVRPLGFDPMCALVAEEDVATAVQLALHRRAEGIFNVAGRDTMPLSRLERCLAMRDHSAEEREAGFAGQVWRHAAEAIRLLGLPGRAGGRSGGSTARTARYHRYGFTLDTRRAEAVLGFRPAYRIGEDRLPDGRRRLDATLA